MALLNFNRIEDERIVWLIRCKIKESLKYIFKCIITLDKSYVEPETYSFYHIPYKTETLSISDLGFK